MAKLEVSNYPAWFDGRVGEERLERRMVDEPRDRKTDRERRDLIADYRSRRNYRLA